MPQRDTATLYRDWSQILSRFVAFDAACGHTMDPATLLLTRQFSEQFDAEGFALVCRNEYLQLDVNKFAALLDQPTAVGTLSDATAGRPNGSARFREILRPFGFGPEIRATFTTGGSCWASLVVLRHEGRPDFSPDERHFVACMGGCLAHAVRSSLLMGAVTDETMDHDSAPPRGPSRALRGDPEPAATERSQDLEVAAIKGDDGSRPVTLGQDHVRSVRDADALVQIPLDHGASLGESLGIDRGQVPGPTGELPQNGQLGRDAEPRGHEEVELGNHVGRDHQRLRRTGENRVYRLVVGLIRVEEREERAGVDNHRSPKPGRCSSASRAIGDRLAKRPPRGRGRSSPTATRIESRMTSASDTPRCRATRLIADLSSVGK